MPHQNLLLKTLLWLVLAKSTRPLVTLLLCGGPEKLHDTLLEEEAKGMAEVTRCCDFWGWGGVLAEVKTVPGAQRLAESVIDFDQLVERESFLDLAICWVTHVQFSVYWIDFVVSFVEDFTAGEVLIERLGCFAEEAFRCWVSVSDARLDDDFCQVGFCEGQVVDYFWDYVFFARRVDPEFWVPKLL